MDSKEIGILAEGIARTYLIKKGYKILISNYKKPWGEIDIIASKNDKIVFFEVKANKKEYIFGFEPELRINEEKKNKIIKTANFYLNQIGLIEQDWQIDVISVILDLERKKAKIKHFKKII